MASQMSKKDKKPQAAIMSFQREKGFLTRRQLAAALGIREDILSRYLNGKRGLSVRAAFQVSEKSGIPVADLLAEGR